MNFTKNSLNWRGIPLEFGITLDYLYFTIIIKCWWSV